MYICVYIPTSLSIYLSIYLSISIDLDESIPKQNTTAWPRLWRPGFGAHGFADLHRHRAHATPSARDQQPLAGLQMATGHQAVVPCQKVTVDIIEFFLVICGWYVYIYISCKYMIIYTYIYICMYVCMHACMYVCMHACMRVCMYI